MSKMTYEFVAATPEEAIEKGLSELGLTPDEVIVDVVDSGAKGIFGLGSRQAKVSMTLKKANAESKLETDIELNDELDLADTVDAEKDLDESEEDQPEFEEEQTADNQPNDVVNEDALGTAVAVVEDLVAKMGVRAKVVGRIGVVESSSNQPMVLIDIKGDDLSYLIGKQSETLNALQYITSLIVGRELGHWVPMMIDVQGYRERREKQLHQMAQRLAEQVVKSGRWISLEPMPGTERRLVHLILRDRKDVYTESMGEEPNRKVVIFPRES